MTDTDVWVNYKPDEMMKEEVKRKNGKRAGLWMRDKKIFNREKILSRFVAKEIIATYDNENKYYEHTLHSTHITDKRFNTKYVLGLFNSTLFRFYYQNTNSQGGDIFPQIRISSVENLPIKITDNQQSFIDLVDKMLSLHSELQHFRRRFLKRLTDNFDGIKITGTLERFDELDFKQFLAELKKQKITLKPAQQDDWDDYFTDTKAKCQTLTAQITATDAKIDRMVYELYGLTEEEITCIETN